jgi:hypothetical protein
MKPRYRDDRTKRPCAKVNVAFYVEKIHIELAICSLIECEIKITKKNIQAEVIQNFWSLGYQSEARDNYGHYEEAVKIAKKLYPDFYL